MAAHAGAGLQDVDARMAVGELDHVPYINAQIIGYNAEFIGKSDVHVAKAVLDQLDRFCHARRGDETITFDKA